MADAALSPSSLSTSPSISSTLLSLKTLQHVHPSMVVADLTVYFLLQEYLTSDQIYDNFVPICFRYMGDGVPPVKIAAALALAVFLRYATLPFDSLDSLQLFCQSPILTFLNCRSWVTGNSNSLLIVFDLSSGITARLSSDLTCQ